MIRFLALFLFATVAHAFPVCDASPRHARVTVVEAIYPGAACAEWALDRGGAFAAFISMAAITPACSVWRDDFSEGVISYPPGAPDRFVGHELAHVFLGHYHLPGMGGLDFACAS